MGQGEEIKIRSEPNIDIQERGEIFFFYRPKINKQDTHSPDDVQRMYIVLRPESAPEHHSRELKQYPHSTKEGAKPSHGSGHNPKDTKPSGSDHRGGHGNQEVNVEREMMLRLIVMGRKSLPDPKQKSKRPYWGYVELVSTKVEEVKSALGEKEYDTATKGHRRNKPAVPFGEGVYRILRHEGKKVHTHLIYKLEFPSENESNEPQEALNVEKEGSFIIQIKNPDPGRDQISGESVGKKRRAMFPASLQGQFGNLRYHMADPPDFLNYEGCEMLLIPASDDLEEELGMELKTETENEDDHHSYDASCSDLIKTFGEFGSTEALLRGTWV